eukprot:504148-Hanusia_phi.AAC.1
MSWKCEFRTGGIQIAVRIWGEDPKKITNPAERWIAVHGWLDNAGSFDFLAPLLLKKGAKSIACIDLAECENEPNLLTCVLASWSVDMVVCWLIDRLQGHGQSDWRSTGTYHVVDNVADVLYTADALEWKQFCLYAILSWTKIDRAFSGRMHLTNCKRRTGNAGNDRSSVDRSSNAGSRSSACGHRGDWVLGAGVKLVPFAPLHV